MNKITQDATIMGIIRLMVTVIMFINSILIAKGLTPIPFDETAFTETMFNLVTGVLIVYTAYKDLPITKAGKAGHEYTKQIKQDGTGEEV